ncbi:MAG: hypothetical protein J4215_03310 [Candidatus Diapherotrites archaeon]|uniref:Single-stranded DNA binding protein Ssb-like OB fold domain-containing protein n=1 Tax=Candidatus Iainarchaeum sp. TaxID=3101447 RepID=A0A8T4L4Y1_9ARCH|nr:hypothetical protein [Candidatus Diapherotrites archaeon]
MKIADLRPFAKNVDLLVKVLSLNEVREVASKQDGSRHRVTEALVGDDSGTVLLTLWDDGIDRIASGKAYRIQNAFTSLFQKSLRLNLGRNGSIEETDEEVVVNEETNVSEAQVPLLKIGDLKPYLRKVDVIVKALSKNEVREVSSKNDNSTHRVTEALIGDDSGTILLTLWDEGIEKVEVGKSYKIGNAFTSLFQKSLRLNLGRNGTLDPADEEVDNVNEENAMSQKEFKQRPMPGGRGGQNRGSRNDREDEEGY